MKTKSPIQTVRCKTCGSRDEKHNCTQKLRDRVLKLEKASHELESRIIWAIKFMKCPGDGLMVQRTKEGGFSDGIHWTAWFADGLEILGRYKVDRELLGLSKKDREKVLKSRAAKKQNEATV